MKLGIEKTAMIRARAGISFALPDLSAPQDTTDFDSAMQRFESSRPSQVFLILLRHTF
jgi:hypothetical protein